MSTPTPDNRLEVSRRPVPEDHIIDVTIGGRPAGYIRPYTQRRGGLIAHVDYAGERHTRHHDDELHALAEWYTLPEIGWCAPCALAEHMAGGCTQYGRAGRCRCTTCHSGGPR